MVVTPFLERVHCHENEGRQRKEVEMLDGKNNKKNVGKGKKRSE